MKYATMKNYRNRMRQILLLALLVLGGNMAWGQEPEPWSPSSAGIYRLRSHGNSGNNFGVYDENGEPTSETVYSSIGYFEITNGTYTLIFENTRTINMTGQIYINANNGTQAHLIMELGTPPDNGTPASITLKISEIASTNGQKMAFFIPQKNIYNHTQHTITIKGNAPSAETNEDIDNFVYDFSNNFVIDGSGPELELKDGNTWEPKVEAKSGTGRVVGNGMFRIQEGSLTLENVTVQRFSSNYAHANMIQVYLNNANATANIKLDHCYFYQIGAKSSTGSPVLRMQALAGVGVNTINGFERKAVIQNCKFEDIFASYQLAVGSTTAIDNANGTIRTVGNNKTTLAIYNTHITNNYGCAVRWHGACTDSKLKVYNCRIENNFTCLDNNARGGGGLLLKGPADVQSSTIRNNRTQGDGGGIYLSTYTDFGNDSQDLIPDHSILVLDPTTTIENNVAYRNGGGVAIDGIRMKNGAHQSLPPNGMNGPGGILWYAPDGEPFTLGFQLNGGKIIGNKALGIDMPNDFFPAAEADALGLGGGVLIMRNKQTTYYKIDCLLDKGEIIGNEVSSATGKGGGVAIYSPNVVDNPAGTNCPDRVKPQDVIVTVGTTDGTADPMRIEGNKANNGGGLYVEGYSLTYHSHTSQVYTTLLASAYIQKGNNQYGNQATSNGGGVFMKYGTLTMNNCTIDENTAGNDGGGIYVEEGIITTAIRTTQEQSEAPGSSSTLPEPYQDVEYIAAACNGSNYIDTRIMANAQQTIEVRGERGSIGMTQLLYAYVNNNNRLGVRFYSGGIQYSWRQGNSGPNVGTNNTTTSYANMGVTNPEVKIVMNRSRIFLQDATGNYYTNSFSGPDNSTDIDNWQIFKGQNTSPDIAKFYEAKIYTGGTINATTGEVTGGTLRAHLVPCYNTADGKVGVFDLAKWNDGEGGYTAAECFIEGTGTISYKESGSSSGGGSGTVPVSGCTVTSNTAANNGGGIYLNTGHIFLTNSKINSNNATNSSGGGVYNNLGNIYVNYWDAANPTQGTNLTVRGETTPSEFNNNTAGRNGGGLNTHRGRIYMRGQTTSKEITISGNTAGNGGNKGSGGGVFCMGDGSDPTAEQIRLFNVNLIGNKAYGKGTTTTGDETVTNGSGGGIYLQYGGINLTKVKMQGNYARQNGGGLNNHNGVINVRGCTIGGDNYYDSGAALEGNKADSCGGGVYTQLGDINITNHKDASLGDHISKFSHNIAGDNGGGLNTHSGKVVATGEYTDDFSKDIFIDHNTATNGSGGGIFCMGSGSGTLADPDLMLTYVSLVGNKAEEGNGNTANGVITGCGGGMYLHKGAIRVQDADMEGNYANHNGGAINNHEGNILILGSMIGGDNYYSNGERGQGNKAGKNGGGIYTNLGNIDIQDYIEHLQGNVRHLESKVTHNEAGENGGGINTHNGIITVNYNLATEKEREVDHVIEIEYNKAKKGGGIYANAGTIITANAKIENNWATENGGGVNNHAGDITFYGGTLSNNTAESGKGGGAFTFVGDVNIMPFPVDWTGSTTQPTINDGVKIYNNIAKLNGGGINNHTGRVDMRHARMKNNTSSLGNGGGIFCEGPHSNATGFTIRLLCSEVVQNKTRGQDGTEAEPTGRGGGIYLKYGSIYAHSSDILLNSANINGGGVDNHEGTMLLYGCSLDGNTAVTGRGGGIYTHSGDITTGPSIDRNDNTKSRATLIQYNTAKINGGGINNHQGNIFLNGDHILNNTAEEGHGGGIYINNGIIDMYGGKIANNEAKLGDGGGVWSGGGEFNIQKRQGKPIVELIDVEVTGANTATVHYHLIDKGKGTNVTEHGIFWDIDEIDVDTATYEGYNSTYVNKINTGHIQGEDGCYRLNITIPDDLEPAGKTFYTKAYAVNNATPTALSNTSSVAAFTTFSNKPTVLTGGVSNITSNSAEANGKVLYAGTGEGTAITAQGIQVWKKYKKVNGQYVENTPTADDLRPATDLSEFFTVSLVGLQNDTVYCMRAYATNVDPNEVTYDESYSFGEVVEFWTLKDTPTMDGALTITGYELESDGKYKYTFKYTKATEGLTAYGFVISTDDDPELHADGDHTVGGTDHTSYFDGSQSGLEGGTTYYVRAYASKIVNPGTVISNYAVSTPIQFITPNANGDPVVRATEISGITRSSATITGLLVHKGSDDHPIREYGVCFSTEKHHPDHETCTDILGTDPAAEALEDSTYFNIPLTSLAPNTTYYLCIFATNGRQAGNPAQTVYVYSNDYNFTTLPIELPKMEVHVMDITNTTATLECKVDTCGAALVTTNDSYGFMWRVDGNNNYTTVYASNYDKNTRKFSVEIEGLSADTKYWVKAFCSNATGTANDGSGPNESREVSFNTLYPMPVVNAVTIHDILYDATGYTSHTIRVYGNATPGENGPAIKKFGYIYSTRNNATIYTLAEDYDEEAVEVGPQNMGETHITNLTNKVKDNRYYYVRAYASARENPTSDNDYSYGATTRVLTLAQVNRNGDATSTNESAQLPARISSYDEEHHLKKYGVCWAVQPTIPTIGENNYVERDITNESTPLNFSLNTVEAGSALTPGDYYWRAYVKNEDNVSDPTKGIAYTSAGTFHIYALAVTAESLPAAAATITGTGYYDTPTPEISLYAGSINQDYMFYKWTNESDYTVSTDNPYVIAANNLSSSTHFKAYFESKVTIIAGANGKVKFNTGTATSSYDDVMWAYNQPITVCALHNEGYRFANWTNADGDIVSEEANYTFFVTDAIRLTANFAPVRSASVADPNAAPQQGQTGMATPRPRDIYPAPAREPWDWDDDDFIFVSDTLTEGDTITDGEDKELQAVRERISRDPIEPVDVPQIIENKATEGNGGGIYMTNGDPDHPTKLVFSGPSETGNSDYGLIRYNFAAQAGGGIYIDKDAYMQMKGRCEVNANWVPKGKLGGGIYLAGRLYVGNDKDDALTAHALKVNRNFAMDGVSDDYHEITDLYTANPLPASAKAYRNNVFLVKSEYDYDRAGNSANDDDSNVITLLSNISGQAISKDGASSSIGFSVLHGFCPVIATAASFGANYENYENGNNTTFVNTYEKWLHNLMPNNASGHAMGDNGAVFEDSETYIAIHTPKDNSPFRGKYIYLWGSWPNPVVSKDPEVTAPMNGTGKHYRIVNTENTVTAGTGEEQRTYIPGGENMADPKILEWEIYSEEGLSWFTSYVNGLNAFSTGDTYTTGEGDHYDTIHRHYNKNINPYAKAKIMNDLDMTKYFWVPIGSVTSFSGEPNPANPSANIYVDNDDHPFKGEFDGQGHVIKGLDCRFLTGIKKYGLFGELSSDASGAKSAVVKNVFVDESQFIPDNTNQGYFIGGIAGKMSGTATLSGAEARTKIDVTRSKKSETYVGGLVGKMEGDGSNNKPVIHSSMAMPEIHGVADYIGGLVGQLGTSSNLYNSFSNPKFPEDADKSIYHPMNVGKYIGGLVGENNGIVENCYSRLQGNEPTSNGTNSVFGWLAGTNNNYMIKYCYAAIGKAPEVGPPAEPGIPGIANGGEYQRAGTGTISGHGTYTATQRYSGKYGFKHRDHIIEAANTSTTLLVTDIDDAYESGLTNQSFNGEGSNGGSNNGNSQQPATLSTTTSGGLMTILNAWVELNYKANEASKNYATWTRTMASPINDDYPVPMLADFNSVGSKDKIYLLYEDDVNHMWNPNVVSQTGTITTPGKDFQAFKDDENTVASMYLYDVQPILNAATGNAPAVYATVDITGNTYVPLYINEDVGITQPENAVLTARAGVTIKNARDDESNPNWHLFSSAIKKVPIGIGYHTRAATDNYVSKIVWPNGEGIQKSSHDHDTWADRTQWDPPRTSWLGANSTALFNYNANTSANNNVGYFPTNTPYGTWRSTPYTDGSNANNNEDVGFFDLYEYNEYYYHWINYKREGTSDIQDHWHWDKDGVDAKHYRLGWDKSENARYFNDTEWAPGKGYLMALSSESMMMADGILNTGNVTIGATKTAEHVNLPPNGHGTYNYTTEWRALNMIGNPYQSYLDFDKFVEGSNNGDILGGTKEYAVADDSKDLSVKNRYRYYVYRQSENSPYSASRYIHPHQGFFVKAASSGDITFNNDMRVAGKIIINNVNNDDDNSISSPYRGEVNYPLVNLLCYDEDGRRDLTTVEVNRPEFGGGHKMEKLHESKGLIYAHLENESFQTLFTPVGVNVVPVRFVPNEDGIFTLNWNTRHGEFSYLHLIDNIAGVDVDCLTNDEYKFEGKTSDYKSRFKLVFRCDGDEPEDPEEPDDGDDSDHFAFMFGDELVVNGAGLLQMFDIQGRCLMETRAVGEQSSHRIPRVSAGVYLLRLTGESKVKVQKIVIK